MRNVKGKVKIIGAIIVGIMLIAAILYNSAKPISAELLEIQPQVIARSFKWPNNYPSGGRRSAG